MQPRNPQDAASELETIVDIAREVGKLLVERQFRELNVDFKGPTDLVTDADRASEELILKRLHGSFPEDAVLGEEGGRSGSAAEDARLWLVDPLDGTTNYAHGFPIFAVSIALMDQQHVQLGVVHVPLLAETFAARRGQGATLNGQPISISECQRLDQALLGSGFAYDRKLREQNLALWARFVMKTRAVRRAGAAAFDLCCVASGRYDGYWERGLSAWDAAAGSLIVEEAGGVISNYQGESVDLFAREIVAATPGIHRQMLDTIGDFRQ